jgi:hypothetical protein
VPPFFASFFDSPGGNQGVEILLKQQDPLQVLIVEPIHVTVQELFCFLGLVPPKVHLGDSQNGLKREFRLIESLVLSRIPLILEILGCGFQQWLSAPHVADFQIKSCDRRAQLQ